MIFWKRCSRFSKTMLFEGSGSILEVPRTDQNLKKRALDPRQKSIQSKHNKSWFFENNAKCGTLHLDRMYEAFFTFSIKNSMNKTENLNNIGDQQTCFFLILESLWKPENVKIEDFSATSKYRFGYGIHSKSEHLGCTEVDQNGNNKNLEKTCM